MKIFSFLILFCISFFLPVKATPLPLEYIVSIPDVTDVRLSPNGRYVAYMLRVDNKGEQGVLVVMYDSKNNTQKQLAFSDNKKYVITSILWGNNDVLLIKAKFPAKRYGTPTTETRLLKVDIATAKIDRVLPKSIYQRMLYVPNVLSTITDLLPNDDDYILMSLGGFSESISHAVVKVPITGKGQTSIIQRPKLDVIEWLTDAKHQVRLGIALKETTYKIIEKQAPGKYRDLWTFEAFSADEVWPLGFGANNDTLYVSALYQGKKAIYKVNLTDPLLKKELVFYHEHYDVSGSLRYSKLTKDVVGIGYYYWNEEYKNFMDAIDTALPDTDNLLLDFSDDGNTYTLFSHSDNEPGMYLIGQRKNKKLSVLSYKYENLNSELLSQKQRVTYEARDGLTIEGFLTLPKHTKKENLPTIIFPHGGPISYDTGGFDYWTQFFANKGYAVLQMNFRGSSGYGFDFMQQGIGGWGKAMQDDVEDGTRWLIEEGIANKDKICIVGASYGGYAALMGGIKSPDLYQCIISFAGVTDVESLVKSSRYYTHHDVVKKQVGDDHRELWEISPLKHAKKIKVPVLLIHGSKDRVVRAAHSEDMFDELEDEDKRVEFIELDGGDHYLSNNAHRIQTFKAMDEFLNKYLPAH